MYPPCEDSVAEYALARPCGAHERVYMKPRLNSNDFVYVYDYLFKEYNITSPLIDFETGMLNLMNIAPSQLHPNSWAFLLCFELLCPGVQSNRHVARQAKGVSCVYPYDAELMNKVGEVGCLEAGAVMLVRCLSIVQHQRRAAEGRSRLRTTFPTSRCKSRTILRLGRH